jgi:hypothetical protein
MTNQDAVLAKNPTKKHFEHGEEDEFFTLLNKMQQSTSKYTDQRASLRRES